MAYLTEEKKTALEATLPRVEDTVASLRTYLAMSGMPVAQFAKLCGRSESTLRQLFAGRYKGDLLVREAIENALKRYPVGVAPTERGGKLYETENVADIRRLFDYCHKHQALGFVYGPPGSQKTFVIEHLIAEFNRRHLGSGSQNRAFMVRASIEIRPRDLVANICREVGAHVGQSLQNCMSSLRQQLRGTKTVVVIDEAQLCRIPALEALRELHDTEPKLGILLAGSHELKNFFDTRAAELEQWNSRLHQGIALSGVSDECARAILAVECPGLDAESVELFIEQSKVADTYSRDRGRRYLSVRRLFNSIAGIHRLAAEAQEAAQ